jgi:hypothetical protein
VADGLATGEQALSTSVIQAAVERHGVRDARTERLTRERSDIASQLLALGQHAPAANAIERAWYRVPHAVYNVPSIALSVAEGTVGHMGHV